MGKGDRQQLGPKGENVTSQSCMASQKGGNVGPRVVIVLKISRFQDYRLCSRPYIRVMLSTKLYLRDTYMGKGGRLDFEKFRALNDG